MNMKFVCRRVASFVFASSIGFFVGCASVDPPQSPRVTRVKPTDHKTLEFPPAIQRTVGNVDARLRGRIEQKWKALIEGDLTSVYMLMSPNSRKLVTEADFKQQVKTGLWKSSDVIGAKCNADGSVCQVELLVGIVLSLKGAGPTSAKVGRTEDWINVNGEWYFSHFQD